MGFIVIGLIVLFLIACFSNDEKERGNASENIVKILAKIFFH